MVAEIRQCRLFFTLKRPWLIALICQMSNHFPFFWYCTIWLFLTSLEDHRAIIAGPTFLLCYQLKLCEIAPWPLVGSFYLSPLPLQKFQRTGYSLDLPWTVRLTKAKVNSTVSLTFWTLVLFFLLFSFLFIFSFFLIYLLNFNYTDPNIQIVDKLTIKINNKKKWKKLQDLNN